MRHAPIPIGFWPIPSALQGDCGDPAQQRAYPRQARLEVITSGLDSALKLIKVQEQLREKSLGGDLVDQTSVPVRDSLALGHVMLG